MIEIGTALYKQKWKFWRIITKLYTSSLRRWSAHPWADVQVQKKPKICRRGWSHESEVHRWRSDLRPTHLWIRAASRNLKHAVRNRLYCDNLHAHSSTSHLSRGWTQSSRSVSMRCARRLLQALHGRLGCQEHVSRRARWIVWPSRASRLSLCQ